jgi:hypothetical protein
MASAALEYSAGFLRAFGRECYRTWRRDLLGSLLLFVAAFGISAYVHDALAWPTFKLALESTGLVLGIYAVVHLFRTPYLIHLDTISKRDAEDKKKQPDSTRKDDPLIKEPTLDLKLTPYCNNDTSAYLEVLNQGDLINVSAQLQIVGLSTGKGFKNRPFPGQWESETTADFYDRMPEPYAGEVRLERNRSRLLIIASIASMAGMPIQEMAIAGINEECIGWESNPRQSQELPYFTVQITLIAKGYPKTKQATFKVGPKTPHGPFQMTEVAV